MIANLIHPDYDCSCDLSAGRCDNCSLLNWELRSYFWTYGRTLTPLGQLSAWYTWSIDDWLSNTTQNELTGDSSALNLNKSAIPEMWVSPKCALTSSHVVVGDSLPTYTVQIWSGCTFGSAADILWVPCDDLSIGFLLSPCHSAS